MYWQIYYAASRSLIVISHCSNLSIVYHSEIKSNICYLKGEGLNRKHCTQGLNSTILFIHVSDSKTQILFRSFPGLLIDSTMNQQQQ